MKWIDGIDTFPSYVKQFLLAFVNALSFGYFAGFKFLMGSTSLTPIGIEENYNGNENNETAELMKFKKAEAELITTIHTHILSFSLIFFCTGLVLLSIPISLTIKKLLLIEPFISVVITFGGIWLLWLGYSWFKYVIMISGMLITTTFIVQVLFILHGILKRRKIVKEF